MDQVLLCALRLDPMRMLKTFAYQLAMSLPDIQPYLLNLDSLKVQKLTQVGNADTHAVHAGTTVRHPTFFP